MVVVYKQFVHFYLYNHRIGFAHCILVESSTVICWTSSFVILGVPGLFCRCYYIFLWKILSANTVDPDQTSEDVAYDLGLYCLTMTLLRASR